MERVLGRGLSESLINLDEYSGVDEYKQDLMAKISQAVDTVFRGIAKRVDVTDDVKVYRVKNIVRVDIDEKVWLI